MKFFQKDIFNVLDKEKIKNEINDIPQSDEESNEEVSEEEV